MNAFKKEEEGPKNRVINVLYYLQITYGHIIPTLNAPKGLNQMIKHTQWHIKYVGLSVHTETASKYW